jgi:hypothetical protein
MTVAIDKHIYTFEEYLELEETANYKHEYQDGAIVPMTGGTTNHNKIAGNFYFNFRLKLRQQNHKIFIGDVKLWIPRYRQGTYPDVMIIDGEELPRIARQRSRYWQERHNKEKLKPENLKPENGFLEETRFLYWRKVCRPRFSRRRGWYSRGWTYWWLRWYIKVMLSAVSLFIAAAWLKF